MHQTNFLFQSNSTKRDARPKGRSMSDAQYLPISAKHLKVSCMMNCLFIHSLMEFFVGSYFTKQEFKSVTANIK